MIPGESKGVEAMPESEAAPATNPRNPGFSADFPGIIGPVGCDEESRNRPAIGISPDARPAHSKNTPKRFGHDVNPQDSVSTNSLIVDSPAIAVMSLAGIPVPIDATRGSGRPWPRVLLRGIHRLACITRTAGFAISKSFGSRLLDGAWRIGRSGVALYGF